VEPGHRQVAPRATLAAHLRAAQDRACLRKGRAAEATLSVAGECSDERAQRPPCVHHQVDLVDDELAQLLPPPLPHTSGHLAHPPRPGRPGQGAVRRSGPGQQDHRSCRSTSGHRTGQGGDDVTPTLLQGSSVDSRRHVDALGSLRVSGMVSGLGDVRHQQPNDRAPHPSTT
jgi:hypothetical protein